MHELFRLRIAAKRQMTAPQRLMEALALSEGDEIQMEVANGQVVAVHACKSVPTALLSEDLLSEIKKQEQRLAQGEGLSVGEALREIEKRRKQSAQNPGQGLGLKVAESVRQAELEKQERQIVIEALQKSENKSQQRAKTSNKRVKVEYGTGMTEKLHG